MRYSEVRIQGSGSASGSVPKCHGFATLFRTILFITLRVHIPRSPDRTIIRQGRADFYEWLFRDFLGITALTCDEAWVWWPLCTEPVAFGVTVSSGILSFTPQVGLERATHTTEALGERIWMAAGLQLIIQTVHILQFDSSAVTALLHNGRFCNGCITKRICSYKLFIHKKTNIMQIMTKSVTVFIHLIFYYREIVKLYDFMTLSLNYPNIVLWHSRCKIHSFIAAPLWQIHCPRNVL